MTPNNIVNLSDDQLISRGRERICYQHPQDPGLVIKLPQEKSGDGHLANHHELQGYTLFSSQQQNGGFISRCHGFIETNKGRGLLCECIRDHDGAVSRSIWDVVVGLEDCDIDQIVKIAAHLGEFLEKEKIWLFDLNLKNIVLQRLADGSYHPVIIDVKSRSSTNEFLPFSRYIPWFSRKKLRRRVKQLEERIREFHQRRDELRELDI